MKAVGKRKKSRFKKIAIVGVGLIGGSMALEIKRRGLADEVVGVSRRRSTIVKALSRKIIDSGGTSLKEVAGADLVVLASPVRSIPVLGERLARFLKKGAIVTDVGSTKTEIVRRMNKILPSGVYFVGAHPLAGLESRGVENAKSGLFKGALCVITNAPGINKGALDKVCLLWSDLGSRVTVMNVSRHDNILAFVSHLAHIAAFSLVNAVPGEMVKFAASGFRDSTRIALSDDEIWSDIFLSNRAAVLACCNDFSRELKLFKSALKRMDKAALAALIRRAHIKRKLLENDNSN